MKKVLFFVYLFFFCFSSLAIEYPPHVISWAEENVSNIEILEEAQKLSIYHIVSAFYSRLVNLSKYKAFYDKWYQDPKNAKKYPIFVDISKGFYIAIFDSPKLKLTDLPPYQSLKGKTVEEVFGYPGDLRLMDNVGGEGSRQALVADKGLMPLCETGGFNVFYHEFGHLLHLTLLSETEFWRLENLYESAMKENRYDPNSYSAVNSLEYFGEGVRAYFSLEKEPEQRPISIEELEKKYPGIKTRIDFITLEYSKKGMGVSFSVPIKTSKNSRERLERKDPKLAAFIESLIDENWNLKDFESSCSHLYGKYKEGTFFIHSHVLHQ